jgi:glycerol-3-phosphate dehydrogenase
MKLKQLIKKVKKQYGAEIGVKLTEQSIILSGEMEKWEDIVAVGYLFVDRKGKRHVVNNIKLKGKKPEKKRPLPTDNSLDGKEYDCIIIGGGIIGATILRELSRYSLKLLLLEKEGDLARGASGANDGMIHPGIDLKKNSVKAKYCLPGNLMYDRLAEELDFPFERIGQYIVFGSFKDRLLSSYLLYKARQLKIPGVRIISKNEISKIEPEVKPWAKGAVEIKCTGIVSPYETVIAFAENAISNGAEVALETSCLGFILNEGRIEAVKTNRGLVKGKVIINAAGVYADEIAAMANDKYFSIHPRKGTDLIFDSKIKPLVNTIISRFPKVSQRHSQTKGGAIISTVDGNVLVGPDAVEVFSKDDVGTTPDSIARVFNKHVQVLPKLKKKDIIAYFSGLRAATYEEDFLIERSKKIENLIHVAGIQSPGLTAAPAIALDVTKMALSMFNDVQTKADFNPYRKRIKRLKELPLVERQKLIAENPEYGKIICRCEEVSLGEIKAVLKRQLPAKTIDAIKRRIRAGMGRCQGGFCMPLILKIIAEELQLDPLAISKHGYNSEIGLFKTKTGGEGE